MIHAAAIVARMFCPRWRKYLLILVAVLGFYHFEPVGAQSGAVQPNLEVSADKIFMVLQGKTEPEAVFAPAFLAAIPSEQVTALANKLVEQYGRPDHVASMQRSRSNEAALVIAYKRADVTLNFTVDRAPPHAVVGLLITGANVPNDSLDRIKTEFSALHGTAGLAIAKLSDGDASFEEGYLPETRFAIASVMKLYVLAELDQQITAGTRSWSDVVELGPRSHPSGIMQDWPQGDPVTLATLATLMISRSDNTATDTLIRVIGQDALTEMVERSGHAHPEWLNPFLMTQQSTALKMPANAGLRGRFKAAKTDAERARIIAENAHRLTLAQIDFSRLLGQPLHIDVAQWFATPADLISLLSWLDTHMSEEARKLLAINPGIGPGDAARWRYLGYKGGSEAGVLAYTFLAESQDGQRFAIAMAWNDPKAPVDEPTFLALAARVMNLLARE